MKQSEGFSVVELVVTLAVALMFLAAGYMLHQALMLRGASSQWQMKAGLIASSHIAEQRHKAENPCQAKSLPDPVIEDGELPKPTSGSAEISCPYGTDNPISRFTVSVNYHDLEDQEVVRARDIMAK